MAATATLDLLAYPHILDSIIEYCPVETLTQLVRVCTTTRDRILDYYLPVRHIQLLQSGDIHGIDKHNTAVVLSANVVLAFRWAVQLVDIVGEGIASSVLMYDRLRFFFKAARFLPHPRIPNMLVTTIRPSITEDATATRPLRGRTATLPFSFQGAKLHYLPGDDMLIRLLDGIFSRLHKVGERVTIVMVENPGFTYERENHNTYYDRLIDMLVEWLAEPPHPFKLAFVNMEGWLKYWDPSKTTEELRAVIFDDLSFRLHRVEAQGLSPIDCLHAISFMSLDEYKAEVGEVDFDHQMSMHVPDNPRISRLPWASLSPMPADH